VPANLHNVFDQAVDRLLAPLFPFQTFPKRFDDRLGERLSGPLRECSR
jgi:hypothetical protein